MCPGKQTTIRGKIKLSGYQIFEQTRTGLGGGLLTAVKENLNPVLVNTGQDDTAILVVQVKVGNLEVRVINAYGPQEDSCNKGNIWKFWQELEGEIINAKEENFAVLLEFDANAKLGSKIIANDPNCMSENGKIFFDIIRRHNLTVANASPACVGVITRHRSTAIKDETAVLDYIVFCD